MKFRYICASCIEKGGYTTKNLRLEENFGNECSVCKAKGLMTDQIVKKKPNIQKASHLFTSFIAVAEEFIKVQPLYYDQNKLWWIWDFDNKKWKIIDEVDLMNIFDTTTGYIDTIKTNVKNEILEALKRVSRKNKPKDGKESWVQFKDKIVGFNDQYEEYEANEEYFITNPIPHDIGGTEETPFMDKIFEEWVGEHYIETLYEIIAYCMVPSYFVHRIFCLTGSGSNGKSKFLGLIRNFIGKENVTSTELDMLIENRFESTKLYKKLVCVMGETNFNALNKTSLIKRLTGQDMIGFEFKNKNPFDDFNYAKILIATNTLPVTFDKTEGFYRRWLIIDFPNKFSEKYDILKEIPKIEYNNLAKKSIRILKELYEKREFTNEGDIEQRKQRYEEKSNPLGMFIKGECETDPNYEMPFFMFYERYIEYLKQRGYRIQSKNEVGRLLKEEGFERENKNIKKQDGNFAQWKFIFGLKTKGYIEFGGVGYEV